MKWILLILFFCLIIACKPLDKTNNDLLNDAHLDHLYESWKVNGQEIGAIWIYCEAPDYHLVADEDEGFTCVDDVARALVFYCNEFKKSKNENLRKKITSLTSFILELQAENGYFYNFVFGDKTINKTHQNSQAVANWWSWRAFWALSEVNQLIDNQLVDLQAKSLVAMDRVLPYMITMCNDPTSIFEMNGINLPLCIKESGGDQIALVMIGLSNYYMLYPKMEIKNQLINLGNVLMRTQLGDEKNFPFGVFMSWQNNWHAWGNSQAYAMLTAGKLLKKNEFIDAALKEVSSFYPYYLENKPSYLKLEKSKDSFFIIEKAEFPQIAYNLRPMVYASLEAYNITKDQKYAEQASELGRWFLNENQANTIMYDKNTGRTFDGIISTSEINKNSGAESTIEALLSLQAIAKYPEILDLINAKNK